MKTSIKITSRLITLFIIKKLERLNVSFIETETSIVADIDPSRAWSMNIIESGGGFGDYEPVLN
jgi:hypothetical protein